jgi:hypothetical protein
VYLQQKSDDMRTFVIFVLVTKSWIQVRVIFRFQIHCFRLRIKSNVRPLWNHFSADPTESVQLPVVGQGHQWQYKNVHREDIQQLFIHEIISEWVKKWMALSSFLFLFIIHVCSHCTKIHWIVSTWKTLELWVTPRWMNKIRIWP